MLAATQHTPAPLLSLSSLFLSFSPRTEHTRRKQHKITTCHSRTMNEHCCDAAVGCFGHARLGHRRPRSPCSPRSNVATAAAAAAAAAIPLRISLVYSQAPQAVFYSACSDCAPTGMLQARAKRLRRLCATAAPLDVSSRHVSSALQPCPAGRTWAAL
jgi:hypothetical protein